MKRLITYTILLIHLSASFAQNTRKINGYITDAENGEQIIGATVVVLETGKGTISDVDGYYSIPVPVGDYTLAISYIGFQRIEQKLDTDGNLTLNFNLKPSEQLLEAVIVSPEAKNRNVSVNQMSTYRVSSELIKKIPAILGEPDIIKSIQLLPGITSAGDASAGFNVRGGSADQNLVLLDDGIIYNPGHVLGLFSAINPDAVDNVRIFKGGIPSRYGGRLSSVLDVTQKEGNLSDFQGEVGISLISARAKLEGPIVREKGSFLVAARRSYGDAILRLIGDSENIAYFYDVNLKANYKINDNNRIFISGYLGRDEFAFGEFFANDWGNTTSTLKWSSVLSPRLFADFSAVFSDYSYSITNISPVASSVISSSIVNYNLKADLSYQLDENRELDFGIDQIWHRFQPGRIDPVNGSEVTSTSLDNKYALEQGAYLSFRSSTGKLQYDIGFRISRFIRRGEQDLPIYENNQPVIYNAFLGTYRPGNIIGSQSYVAGEEMRSFLNFEPRVGLTYMLSDESSIKVSYNRMYQYLHLISNTISPTPVDVWAPSGRYIDPQIADQYAAGYYRNFNENLFEASFEIYYKDIQNVTDYVDGADLIANNTIETQILSGIGRAYGAELYVKKNRGRLTGWVSYTLSRSERRITGLAEGETGINNGEWYVTNFNKTHDLSITTLYDLTERWSLSSNFILASGLPSTFPEGRYNYAGLVIPHFGNRNQDQLPMYHRLDLSATLKHKPKNGNTDRGEWIFGLFNAYNRFNANSIFFRENAERPGETSAFMSAFFGITPNITYNIRF